MQTRLLMLSVKIQTLLNREEGQDLIEYALVVALIAFAATAGTGASVVLLASVGPVHDLVHGRLGRCAFLSGRRRVGFRTALLMRAD